MIVGLFKIKALHAAEPMDVAGVKQGQDEGGVRPLGDRDFLFEKFEQAQGVVGHLVE